MNVPKNVLWFEVLLYLSLMLDALSVAFEGRTPSEDMTDAMILASTMMAAGLILLMVYFVWLAARKRKNWPRSIPTGTISGVPAPRSIPTPRLESGTVVKLPRARSKKRRRK